MKSLIYPYSILTCITSKAYWRKERGPIGIQIKPTTDINCQQTAMGLLALDFLLILSIKSIHCFAHVLPPDQLLQPLLQLQIRGLLGQLIDFFDH